MRGEEWPDKVWSVAVTERLSDDDDGEGDDLPGDAGAELCLSGHPGASLLRGGADDSEDGPDHNTERQH